MQTKPTCCKTHGCCLGKTNTLAQRILLSPLQTHGKAFEEESLLTLMVETEGILNSRPLTVVNYHFHQQKFSL